MATLTVQPIPASGLSPTFQAASASGDKVRPGATVFLHVKNDNVASVTVTLNDPNSTEPDGAKEFDPDVEIVIEPSGFRLIPVPESRFRNVADGLASWTYSTHTDVSLAAVRR